MAEGWSEKGIVDQTKYSQAPSLILLSKLNNSIPTVSIWAIYPLLCSI